MAVTQFRKEQLKSKDRMIPILLTVFDDAINIRAGSGRVIFRTPFNFELTDIRASTVIAPTGSAIMIDFRNDKLSILRRKLSIDVGEKTSKTAQIPVEIMRPILLDDSENSIDVIQIGSGHPGTGLRITLIGHQL